MFEKIAIGIKTFLRDEKLFHTINSIDRYMPGAQMIIADCGNVSQTKTLVYAGMEDYGHKIIRLPFDAGFGAMSNAISEALKRDYLLIGSDDFDFSEAAPGIEKLYRVLQFDQDIASGRVNNNPYEFFLEIYGGGVVKEIPVQVDPRVLFEKVDLTVNYSMIRREALEKVGWDNEVKIGGGEHGAFFYDAKKAGLRVVFVPGVNISEQPGADSELYREFRRRARNPERPCFEKRGIVEYILGNGTVDYKKGQ